MTDTDIEIRIKTESAKASKDIANLNKQIDKMNKTIAKGGKVTEQNVGQMTRSFKSLTAHVSKLALIYGTFKTLLTGTVITAKFEQSIKKLGIYSGAAAEDLTLLEQKAKDLGESTMFSASQVAEGMNQMALAGLNSSQMLAGIGDVLNLSAVGMISLQEAADMTTTTMKTFGLEAKDMNDITDVLAKTATISATTVTELGVGLTKVGSVANDTGTSLAETAALLGVLADGGRRGAEAGNQLKMSMLRLSSNPEAKIWLEKLGKEVDDLNFSMFDATGKLLPFTTQLEKIKGALKGVSEESRLTYVAKIFGTEAVAGANIMMTNLEKVHEHLTNINDAMKNDFATQAAKAMMDTLIGSFKNLMSALEGLAIKIVGDMTPALREMLDQWTETIRGMDPESIGDISDALSGFIILLGAVTSVFTTVIGALGSWSAGNKNLTESLATLAIAILLIRKYSLITDKALWLLAKNPVFIAIAAGVIAYDMLTDSMERSNKVLAKTADIATDAATASTNYTSKLEKFVTVLDDGTVAMGANNAERGVMAVETGKAIRALQEADAALSKNTMGEKAYNEQKRANKIQLELYFDVLRKMAPQWVKETAAVEKETQALIKNAAISAKASENYDKFAKVLEKRIVAAEKAVAKIIKAEQGLVVKQAQLSKERADIISKYADERLQILEDYDKIEYESRTAGLSSYRKYVADMLRADELLSKAKKSFSAENFAESERYYSEAKALASSYSGTVIEENGKVLASATDTAQRSSKIFTETKKGELDLIRQKKIAELEANQFKMDLIALELEMQQALLLSQVAIIEELRTIGDVAKETKEKFDKPDYLEKINKDYDELQKRLKDERLEAQVDINKLKHDNKLKLINADYKKINDTVIKPPVDTTELEKIEEKAYHIEKQLKVINGVYTEVWIKVYDEEVDESLAKTYKIEKQLKIINGEKTEVWVKVYDEEVTEAVVEVEVLQAVGEEGVDIEIAAPTDKATKDVNRFVDKTKQAKPVTQELVTDVYPAYNAITQFLTWVNAQVGTMSLRADDRQGRIDINSFVRWASSQVVRVAVVTYNGGGYVPKTNYATGGLVGLAEGGTFTGSGRVAGYDSTDSDKVTAMLTGGEFVIRRQAVDSIGLSTLHAINSMTMQKPQGYADGGVVGGSGSGLQPINLNIGGESFKVMSDRDVADALTRYISTEGGL